LNVSPPSELPVPDLLLAEPFPKSLRILLPGDSSPLSALPTPFQALSLGKILTR